MLKLLNINNLKQIPNVKLYDKTKKNKTKIKHNKSSLITPKN